MRYKAKGHEKDDLIVPEIMPAFEPSHVAVGVHLGYLGEHGSRDGHGEKRIRKGEPQACVGDDRRPVVKGAVCGCVLNRDHHESRAHDENGRNAYGERFFQGGVAKVDAKAQFYSISFQGRKLYRHLDENSEGGCRRR